MEPNYLSILVVSIGVFLIGWLWFSQVLFMNLWLKYGGGHGKGEPDKNAMIRSMALGFLTVLVMVGVTDYFVDQLLLVTFSEGAWFGFLVWLGFFATSQLGIVLWEGKSPKLYLILTGHNLVTMVLAGGVLAMWE